MADVKVRNLPDWVVASFRIRAEHAGHSLEEEFRLLLTEEATKRRQELLRKVRAHQDQMRRNTAC